MKNFFKNLFSGKYPHRTDDPNIKEVYAGPERMNRDRDMRCVYAGPEEMRKRRPHMEKVYAGPPERYQQILPGEEDDVNMEDVYMGPEPDEPEEPLDLDDPEDIWDAEDPEDHEPDTEIEDPDTETGDHEPDTVTENEVSDQDTEPEATDADKNAKDRDRAITREEAIRNAEMMAAVYYGPPTNQTILMEAMVNNVNMPNMMMAYFGPNGPQLNNTLGFMSTVVCGNCGKENGFLTNTCTYCGAFLPGRMIGDLGPVKTCTKCSRENGPLAGTCSFCGGELIPAEGEKLSTAKSEESKTVTPKWCPNCGAPVIEGAKNCLCGFTFEEEANV